MTPVPIATGSNRLNSSGAPAPQGIARSDNIITSVVQPGSTLTLPNAGSKFYFVLLTSPLLVRPVGGSFNVYSQGTGLVSDPQNYFTKLELWNNTPNPVVFSIFVGFGEFIDRRLIEVGGIIQGVLYSTYDGLTAPANNVVIPDLSGSAFFDSNGKQWLAVQRTALDIFNTDSGQAIILMNSAATRSVANVTPLSGLSLVNLSGNFRIKPPVANVNGIVSEVYAAVIPSLLSP